MVQSLLQVRAQRILRIVAYFYEYIMNSTCWLPQRLISSTVSCKLSKGMTADVSRGTIFNGTKSVFGPLPPLKGDHELVVFVDFI